MKILVLILVLGVLGFFWHRQEVAHLASELESARAALSQAKAESAANPPVPTSAAEALPAGSDDGRLRAVTAEADKLRSERDALLAELNALRAPAQPAEPGFDSSPMTSFGYGGTRLVEARITEVGPAGVIVTGKDGRSVVVEIDQAIKIPELRIRAREAMQAALAGR